MVKDFQYGPIKYNRGRFTDKVFYKNLHVVHIKSVIICLRSFMGIYKVDKVYLYPFEIIIFLNYCFKTNLSRTGMEAEQICNLKSSLPLA